MKKQKPRPVWVVEVLKDSGWWPYVAYTKALGRRSINSVKRDKPTGEFRLRKYLPQED